MDSKSLDFIWEHTRQHESEIIEMVGFILNRDRLGNIVEIGCFEGGTAYLWAQLVKDHEGKVFTIDVQFGPGDKGPPEIRNRCLPIYRGTEVESFITEIEGNSGSADTINQLSAHMGQSKADLLFIDGAHLWTDCMADFENYSPFVRDGGWIAFHDIMNPGTPSVGAFWQERIKPRFETWEFILANQPREIQKTIWTEEPTGGIGLMRWKEK